MKVFNQKVKRVYKCDTCNHQFRDQASLNVHLRCHSGEKPFLCDICGKGFSQSGNLSKHRNLCQVLDVRYKDICMEEGNAKQDSPLKRCHICKKTFEHKSDLTRHLHTHIEGETLHKCPLCNKAFRNKGYINVHLRIHAGTKPFPCRLCNKSFTQTSQRNIHMKTCHYEDNNKCHECEKSNKKFVCKRNLQRHMSTAHVERIPYRCDKCGKTFTSRYEWRRHTDELTTDSSFKCLDCNKDFCSRHALQVHKKNHRSSKSGHSSKKFHQLEKRDPKNKTKAGVERSPAGTLLNSCDDFNKMDKKWQNETAANKIDSGTNQQNAENTLPDMREDVFIATKLTVNDANSPKMENAVISTSCLTTVSEEKPVDIVSVVLGTVSVFNEEVNNFTGNILNATEKMIESKQHAQPRKKDVQFSDNKTIPSGEKQIPIQTAHGNMYKEDDIVAKIYHDQTEEPNCENSHDSSQNNDRSPEHNSSSLKKSQATDCIYYGEYEREQPKLCKDSFIEKVTEIKEADHKPQSLECEVTDFNCYVHTEYCGGTGYSHGPITKNDTFTGTTYSAKSESGIDQTEDQNILEHSTSDFDNMFHQTERTSESSFVENADINTLNTSALEPWKFSVYTKGDNIEKSGNNLISGIGNTNDSVSAVDESTLNLKLCETENMYENNWQFDKDNDVDSIVPYGPANINEEFQDYGHGAVDKKLIMFGPANIKDDFGQFYHEKNDTQVTQQLPIAASESLPQYGPANFNEQYPLFGPINLNQGYGPENINEKNSEEVNEKAVKYAPENYNETLLPYGPLTYDDTTLPYGSSNKQADPVIGGGDNVCGKTGFSAVKERVNYTFSRKDSCDSIQYGPANLNKSSDLVQYGPPNFNETLDTFSGVSYDHTSSGMENPCLDYLNCGLFEGLNCKVPSKAEIYAERTGSSNIQNDQDYTSVGDLGLGSVNSGYMGSVHDMTEMIVKSCEKAAPKGNNMFHEINRESANKKPVKINDIVNDSLNEKSNGPVENLVETLEVRIDRKAEQTGNSGGSSDVVLNKTFSNEPFETEVCFSDFTLNNDQNPSGCITNSIDNYFICEICSKAIQGKQNMQKHLKQHTKLKPYICKQCNGAFASKSSMNHHLLLCKVLNVEKIRKSETQDHFPPGKFPFTCTVCKESFSHKSHWKKHLLTHVDQKMYQCDTCKKLFRHHSALQSHLRIHTGEKPFICKFCSKCFRQSSQLTIHVRSVHTGEKPFVCKTCNKGFSDKSHLQRHMFAHSGEKPFQCEICSKSFAQRYHLSQHLQTHSENKQDICAVCDKSFASKAGLKRHMVIHNVQ